MKKHDYVVVIGRFQPFHDGHLATIKKAYEVANNVIIVIGSANAAPTPKNPFSASQRQDMIIYSILNANLDASKVSFIHVEDRRYKEHKWIEFVQSSVSSLISGKTKRDVSIALIGHEKDASSYYLKNCFPSWTFVDTGPYIKENVMDQVLSSTKIRELMFEQHLGYTESNLPYWVYRYLSDYILTDEFDLLQQEYFHAIAEEKRYEHLPYGMNFITADSVVVQSGHVLLVQRDDYPGKGLWALPGVHVGQDETWQEASIRALVQETHLKVPVKVLNGSLKGVKEFDHPERSLRARLTKKVARTVTMAYYYELDYSQPLPKNVRGGEGIRKAWWFPFHEVKKMRNQLFEDHSDILDYFIG